MKTFIVELYIQALTTDLNDLERQKNDDDKEKVSEASNRLANGFIKLADVLHEHLNVSSECVLTSYSLKPSKETLLKIEGIARRNGYEVLDTGQWKCKLHPPISMFDDVCVECEVCGDFMGKLELSAALNTNLMLNDALTSEQLGISSQLCDDLAVLLCSPRYQFLSWKQKWRDLHRLCALYLYSPERTKNYVTDLKFLDIDYSIFQKVKHEPLEEDDELNMINNCEDLMAEEFKTDKHINKVYSERKKPGRKKINEYIDVFIPPKANSDPTVLKSLRSFRKAFKRTSSDETENNSNENTFGNSSTYDSPAQNSLNVNNCTNVNNYENTLLDSINNVNSFMGYTNIDHNFKPKRAHTISNNDESQQLINGQFQNLGKISEYSQYMEPSSDKQNDGTSSVYSHSTLDIPQSYRKSLDSNTSKDINLTNNLGNQSENDDVSSSKIFLDQNKSTPCKSNENKTDIMSKAIVEPTEKVSCTEDKVPPWEKDSKLRRTEHDRSLPGHSNGFVENENFCERVGSFSEKDDKGGITQNTKETNDTNATNINSIVKEKKLETNDLNRITNTEGNHNETKEVNIVEHYVNLVNKNSLNDKNYDFLINGQEQYNSIDENEYYLLYGMNDVKLDNNNEFITTIKEEQLLASDCDEPSVVDNIAVECNVEDTVDETVLANNNTVENVNNCERHLEIQLPDSTLLTRNAHDTDNDSEFNKRHKREISKRNHKFEPVNVDLSEAGNSEVKIFVDESLSPPINIIEPISNVNKNENHTIEEKMQQLKEKFQLKELRILLPRLDFNQHETKKFESDRPFELKYLYNKKKENKKRKSRKRRRWVSQRQCLSKDEYKSSPLQDVNPRVLYKRVESDLSDCPKKNPITTKDLGKLIPRVVLKRLDMDKLKKIQVNSVLSNIPGLRDTEMIRPSAVDNVVQVVQIAGGRSSTTVQTPSNQTSTQVTPHIQRIGQPRIDKPESNTTDATSVAKSSTTTTNTKPTSAQPSTLINILSQQIIRPGQSANIRPPRPPFINILSQQIIRPANSTASAKLPTNTTATDSSQVCT